MSHNPHLFADRIVNLAVTGHLVRIELASLVPPATEGAAPQLQPSQTLVMPLDGFLASFGMMEAVIKKLLANGLLKQEQPEQPPSQPVAS